jgi:transcription elongation factor GreA
MIKNMKKTYFRRPILQFTRPGYQALQEKHERLTQQRVSAIKSLQTAREMGDLSENGAYKAARFEVSSIDRQLRHLNYQLRFGKIITHTQSSTINFGSLVTINDGNKELTFSLVEKFESDPSKQKISLNSPLGKALFGKQTGDRIVVTSPAGIKEYTIISVR